MFSSQMKIIIILILSVAFQACRTTRIDVSETKYSTGHMGMPGEYVFIIKKDGRFCYCERLGYSEGSFVWINKSRIKLTSRIMSPNDDCYKKGFFLDISNEELVFKGNKLLYYSFVLDRIKE